MKKFLAFVLSLTMLFGISGGICTVFAASQTDEQSLGAVEPCAGHTLGIFNDLPACVDENGDLHICENNFPDKNFREEVLGLRGADDGYFTENEAEEITYLNVYGQSVSSLKGVEFFASLTNLDCGVNQLTQLDVSRNPALETLYCYDNQLTQLDVSGNPALTDLSCFSNQLTRLDVSGNPVLADLSCSSNQLTELDVSGSPALTELNCGYNLLTQLDVSGNPALTDLSCESNQLTQLDLSGNPALETLYCSNNQLTQLDLSENPALTTGFFSQSVSLELIPQGDFWVADLSELVSPDHLNRIVSVDGGEFDSQTGVVRFDYPPFLFTYEYDVGREDLDTMRVVVYPTEPEDPTEPTLEYGDLNNDGKYTATDSMYIRLIVAELDQPAHNINYEAADVNGDGKYTAADTMYIRRLVAELITLEELPVNR